MNAVEQKKTPVRKKPVQRAAKKKPATVYSKKALKDLSANLQESINPFFLTEKNGYSGEKVIGFEEWRVIDCANKIFGFNGWSHSVSEQILDFIIEHDGLFDSGVCSIVKVQIKDGSFHEEVGYGHVENAQSRAEAMEKARKLSSSDGLIQAFRHFGNALGNNLKEPAYVAAASNFFKELDIAQNTSVPVAPVPKKTSDLEAPSTSSRAPFVSVPDLNNHACSPRTSSTREIPQASAIKVSVNDCERSPVSPKRSRMTDVKDLNFIAKNAHSTPSRVPNVISTSSVLENKANAAPVSKVFSPSKLPANPNTSGSNDNGKRSFSTVPNSPSSPSHFSVPSASPSPISSSPLSAEVNESTGSKIYKRVPVSSSFRGEQERSLQDEERLKRRQRAKAQQEEVQRRLKEHLQNQEVLLGVNSIKVDPGLPSPTRSRNMQPRLTTDQNDKHLQSQEDFVLLDVNSIKVEPGLDSPTLSTNIPPKFTTDQSGTCMPKRTSYLQFK